MQTPISPPSPPSPPSGPSGPPAGTTGATTSTIIVGIHNVYAGLTQLETVTAQITNPNGFVVNEGVVTFQVNGQTIVAPVHNGVATVTFATGLLDFSNWFSLFFPHSLTASYSDSAASSRRRVPDSRSSPSF